MRRLILIFILSVAITGCGHVLSYQYGSDLAYKHADPKESYMKAYRACAQHMREFRADYGPCKYGFWQCLEIRESIIGHCLYKRGWKR